MTAFGKYQVVEQIGEGGFGKIYKGWDPQLKRSVAIKTCSFAHPELRLRFIREAEVAANLQHPHIVTVYDFGEQDGEPYLVQEFLTGEDLDRKIARAEDIPLPRKIEYLKEIADGLGFAHSRGVVHRDVKPANIRIQDNDQVRIMDFGIAKLMYAEQQLTQAGLSLGTVGYLSPEQLAGQDVDPRADIFSFGVLAYELVTYRRPFEGESITAIFFQIAHQDPPSLAQLAPSCPPALVACIDRCLRKDRNERYGSLTDVIADLDQAAQQAISPSVAGAFPPAPTAGTATGAFGVGSAAPPPAGAGNGPASASASPATPVDATPAALGVAAGAAPGAGSGIPAPAGTSSAAPPAVRARQPLSHKPAFWGLLTAAAAIAIFGILNLTSWGEGSTPGGSGNGGVAVDSAMNGGGVANADSARTDSSLLHVAAGDSMGADGTGIGGSQADGTPGDRQGRGGSTADHSGQSTDGQNGQSTGGTTTGGGVGQPTGGDTGEATRGGGHTGGGGAAAGGRNGNQVLDAARVLVLLQGDMPEITDAAEAQLLQEIARGGFQPVDATALGTAATTPAEAGRAAGAATVLVGQLSADATPSVNQFFTGTASLTIKLYDAATGKLLGAANYQVGKGGTPGKLGPSASAAAMDAARQVVRQATNPTLQKLRDRQD